MKKILSFLFLISLFIGCASSRSHIKSKSPDTEVVEAEGQAPIINGNIIQAKKTSLNEALKNALGLVIGVYISHEAYVSKAMLIEDNIVSQTEGYVEKYHIIKEYQEGEFYKTRIKALIRKEDLSKKIKALELEPKRLGNPIVGFSIEEYIDGENSSVRYAEQELKKYFIDKEFTVSDSQESDIQITGIAESNFNTDQGLGGLMSYRAVISIKAIQSGSNDVITTFSETAGGVDSTAIGAAKASITNAMKKFSKELPDVVLKFLYERSIIQLSISNVKNINKLNNLTTSIRALIEVKDCWTRNYANGTAVIDMDLRKGIASDIAKRLEQLTSHKIKINKSNTYAITAEIK